MQIKTRGSHDSCSAKPIPTHRDESPPTATAVSIAYAKELYGLERNLSFTLILPTALLVMMAVGLLASLFDRPTPERVVGLTWLTRRQLPAIPAENGCSAWMRHRPKCLQLASRSRRIGALSSSCGTTGPRTWLASRPFTTAS